MLHRMKYLKVLMKIKITFQDYKREIIDYSTRLNELPFLSQCLMYLPWNVPEPIAPRNMASPIFVGGNRFFQGLFQNKTNFFLLSIHVWSVFTSHLIALKLTLTTPNLKPINGCMFCLGKAL